MLNFQCTQCQTAIQSEYQYIGELVECPICQSLQIVPDPILQNGTQFHGYLISNIKSTTMLWNVYEAVGISELKDKHVIIRVPTTFFLKHVSNFDQFVKTIVTGGSLNLPSIPSLLDRCIIPGKVYFVFSYIKEAYKITYFEGKNKLEPSTTLLLAKKIATTLDKLWEKEGIIHQNILPRNIKITEKLNIRINNIGLSKFLLKDQQLIDYGFNIWDYHYMCPEFIEKGIADSPSCDIYALGAILFQLSTGVIPHQDILSEEVSSAPIPSAIEYNNKIPQKMNVLIQLMMAPNPTVRLHNWSEVIERIDKIMNEKYQNITPTPISRKSGSITTSHPKYQNIGMQAGDFKKKYLKTSTEKFEQKSTDKMTDTVAKLASKGDLIAINNKWSTRRTKKSTTATTKRANPTPYIITAIVVLSLGFIFYLFYLANQRYEIKKERARVALQNSSETEGLFPEREESTPKVQTIDTKTLKAIKTEKRKLSNKKGVNKKDVQIKLEIEEVDKFIKENPTEIPEALKRYDLIITNASFNERTQWVDLIQLKINQLSNRENQIENDKITAVIDSIKTELKPLLQNKEYDKALKFLREYDGLLSKESKISRFALAEKIVKKIATIKASKNDNEAAAQLSVALFALDLINDNFLKAKLQIALDKQLNSNESIKKMLENFEHQLTYYEDLAKKIQKNKNINFKILLPTEKFKDEEPHLLLALLYLKKEQFSKSNEEFNKLPYNCGIMFTSLVAEKKAEVIYTSIMKKFDLVENTESTIISQLTKNKLNTTKASKLKIEIAKFANDFSKTELIKKKKNDIIAIETYCNIITKDQNDESDKKITIKPNINENNSGASLFNALENTKTGSIISLANGVYKLNDLIINQADITLIGERNVIINAKKTIVSGHNIIIKNIKFIDGTLKISNAYNITFEDCIFNAKESQLKNIKNVNFINSIIYGVKISNSNKLLFSHCTFLTPKGGIEAPIRITSGEFEIADSIIDGEKYGLMIINNNEKSKKRFIHHTLWYAKKAFAVKQFANSPIEKKHIALKGSQVRKFAKAKSNIYKAAIFTNPREDDFRLQKGAPGSKGSSKKQACGANFIP